MCISKVGKIKSIKGKQATVSFFDGTLADDVDLSMVMSDAHVGSFIEVFSNIALSNLSKSEARARKEAWLEIKGRRIKRE